MPTQLKTDSAVIQGVNRPLVDGSRNEKRAKADALRFQQTFSQPDQRPLNEAAARETVQRALDRAAADRDYRAGQRAARAVVDRAKARTRAATGSVVIRTLEAVETGIITGLKRIPVLGEGIAAEEQRFDEQLDAISSASIGQIFSLSPPGQVAKLIGDTTNAARGRVTTESIVAQRIAESALQRSRARKRKQPSQSGSSYRPCPTPGKRCRDGSRCGGRAASVRGKTAGYDGWGAA